MGEMTPMMKQYLEIKKDFEDTVLFFRIGDFYEMFYEDAKTASEALDLVLTGKDCGLDERAPMCGIPFHSADSYIARLVSKGYKVAICEQTEDPAKAVGLVKREVIRIITPGSVIESSMLDEGKNNYLASVASFENVVGLCFCDISTGDMQVTCCEDGNIYGKAVNEFAKFAPAEIVMNAEAFNSKEIKEYFERNENVHKELLSADKFDLYTCKNVISKHFGKDVESFEFSGKNQVLCALGAAILYLCDLSKNDLANVTEVRYYTDNSFMKLDFSARRNLELCETMRNRERRGSLIWVMDKTKTAMGKRLMRSWIEQPLINTAQIIKRQNAVLELVNKPQSTADISGYLSNIKDMERLITRISYKTANARELRSLCDTVSYLKGLKESIDTGSSKLLNEIRDGIDTLDDVFDLIDNSITEDPPFSVREGELIKTGFSAEVDELREIVNNGKGYIASIEQKEQERTGIKKLKIGYNRVFGYYIEVSNSFKEDVPSEYVRKQTLTNCERYITQELKDSESKVLGAQERIVSLEYEVFSAVRDNVAKELSRIQSTSHYIAVLDVLYSFSVIAVSNKYVCPEISQEPVIEIKDGRHPVVEKMLSNTPFVPNDTRLDTRDNLAAIITGPNMAGKSTYMRQVAIIVIMAQMGSFVPASYAKVGITDSVFTRVGASDDLSSGQSTFMVEMNEVADILKSATKNSLIILDEIGRGTSTFDGMSIARAVLEYVCDRKKLGAKTLFATHYHELTELENEIDGIKNYNIACKKRGDDIIFLRRIIPGCADGSYGVEVAKLAGVPTAVVKRAKEILKSLESGESTQNINPPTYNNDEDEQISFMSEKNDEIINTLRKLDVNTLTPIESMKILYELSDKAKD